MSTEPNGWATGRTIHDLPADQVVSALQKEIRRGHTENAALLAYELLTTDMAAEALLWQRLLVISVEDVGMGRLDAPILIQALYSLHQQFERPHHDRYLFAIHAVRFLCECPKDRSSDELLSWMTRAMKDEGRRPLIPEYALDMHTLAGQQLGRGLRHFLIEGAQVEPELAERLRQEVHRPIRASDGLR